MKRILVALVFGGAACAQNSDLGLLLGVSAVRSEVSGVRASAELGAHMQINYAAQLKETSGGRLYLELPLLLGGQMRASVQNGVSASSGAIVYFTPGIRWNLPVHDRVSLYGTAGVGLAGFGGHKVTVTGRTVSTHSGFETALAGGAGGGLDLRLSRLMSLRVEARDFITRAGLGAAGHNHVVFGFGVGFHW